MTQALKTLETKPGDRAELEHIGGGGRWCIDGRKERRLSRLGYIEVHANGYGWQLSKLGNEALRALLSQAEGE